MHIIIGTLNGAAELVGKIMMANLLAAVLLVGHTITTAADIVMTIVVIPILQFTKIVIHIVQVVLIQE